MTQLRSMMMANPLGAFNQGRQIGEEDRTKRTLAQYMQPAIRGDQTAQSAIFSADPEAGFKVQQYAQGQQKDAKKQQLAELRRAAGLYSSAPPELKGQLYSQIKTLSEQAGIIPANAAPASLDTPESQATFGKFIAAIASSGDEEGAPAGVREFNGLTQGLSPEDVQEARRVKLGLSGRASSAGYSQVKFTDAQGRERIGVMNGKTGQIDLPDGTSFNPQTGAIAQTQGAGPAAQPPGAFIDPSLPPEVQAQIRQSVSQGKEPPAEMFFAGRPQSGGDAFTGRRKEDEAGAVTAAQESAKLSFLPQELGMRSAAAIQQARGTEQAKTLAERANETTKRATNAGRDIDQIDEALAVLPKASGGMLPAGRDKAASALGISTEGAKANAQLKLIAAGLIANVPRFEGPQSNIDVQFYREAAGDLANELLPVDTRMAAAEKLKELRSKAASQRPSASGAAVQRARNPQTGETLVLRNGQWVPE